MLRSRQCKSYILFFQENASKTGKMIYKMSLPQRTLFSVPSQYCMVRPCCSKLLPNQKRAGRWRRPISNRRCSFCWPTSVYVTHVLVPSLHISHLLLGILRGEILGWVWGKNLGGVWGGSFNLSCFTSAIHFSSVRFWKGDVKGTSPWDFLLASS